MRLSSTQALAGKPPRTAAEERGGRESRPRRNPEPYFKNLRAGGDCEARHMSTDSENEAHRETARQIQLQRPGWMVMYGPYSRQYIALPLRRAPRGTIVAAGN